MPKEPEVIKSDEWKTRRRYSFKTGNLCWMNRAHHGPRRRYETAQDLWDAAVEYFEFVESHPLKEEKVYFRRGKAVHVKLNKMQAMTITQLCIFLGIVYNTWKNYKTNDTFSAVCWTIENVIYNYNISGSAAGLLDSSIVSRVLGLKEIHDHRSSDASMTPRPSIDLSKISTEDLLKLEQLSEKYSDGSATESDSDSH